MIVSRTNVEKKTFRIDFEHYGLPGHNDQIGKRGLITRVQADSGIAFARLWHLRNKRYRQDQEAAELLRVPTEEQLLDTVIDKLQLMAERHYG